MAHDIVVRGSRAAGDRHRSRVLAKIPAHAIYATPEPDLASAVSPSRARRAGFLYVTDLPGSPDPNDALPGYRAREAAGDRRRLPVPDVPPHVCGGLGWSQASHAMAAAVRQAMALTAPAA